jgi:SAM-dependent methyltransferase
MSELLVQFALILIILVFVAGASVLVMSLASLFIGGAPYGATPLHVLQRMLEAAAIRPGEKVYDLGSGDGRLLIDAHKEHGAVAVGIEISPFFCWISRIKARVAQAEVTILRGSFFRTDFSDADVVFCYLLPAQMKRLAPRFARLGPGTRIVSLRFEIPGWRPVQRICRDGHRPIPTIWVYRVGEPPS